MIKEFKSIVFFIPENSYDLFIDIKLLEQCRKLVKSIQDKEVYKGIVLGFGNDVFVFDVNSCQALIPLKLAQKPLNSALKP